jgi:hypothetical protein
MIDSSASTSEHVYRGWEIRITDTAVDTKFSASVEVWKPEHDPRGHRYRRAFPEARCVSGGCPFRRSCRGEGVD